MQSRFFVIVLIAFMLQTPAGDCGSGLIDFASALPTSYPASNDPTQKAAEGSATAAQDYKDAIAAKNRALSDENLKKSPPDYKDIDLAISKRQSDPSFKQVKATMLRAEGKDVEAALLEAEAHALYMGMKNGTRYYFETQTRALDSMSKKLPPGPGRDRVQARICENARATWKAGGRFDTFYQQIDPYDGPCGHKDDYAPKSP